MTINISPIKENQIENETALNIIKKLNGLGLRGIKIESAIIGPILTGFPLTIPNNIPIKKIISARDDIAIACKVESIDIRRLNGDLVIFVPNKERTIVDFKDALFWFLKDEEVSKMNLPILLGTDFEGNNKAIDLANQPHILIAGTTGGGKSIFESNIIASLSMIKSKNELRLHLIDTKGLDLTLFNKLEHLENLVTKIDDWYSTINELIGEVSRRNRILQKYGARNIQEFNSLSTENKLPYIVVVIDELADLLDKDKEYRTGYCNRNQFRFEEPKPIDSLRRLIQICRASGIHVIACTQRTSVDIINGVVKANFPTRIALKVASGIDSKVILDSIGAENLLGKGDMLVKRNDNDSLERFHGPFVKLDDIKQVIDYRDMILSNLED